MRSRKQLISCGRDKSIRVWDAETGTEVRQLDGHTGAVTALALSADGRPRGRARLLIDCRTSD